MNGDNSLNSENPESLEFRIVLPLFLIVMIDAFSITVILPLLPYYAVAFGLDTLGLGILLATSPALELMSGPMYRVLSKKLGRKPVLIGSQIGTVLGFLLLGAASAVWMLFLARIIDGIAGGNNSIGRRLVRDSLTPSTRTQGMGFIEAAYTLGFLAGPLVGFVTLALTNDDYRMIPYVAAFVSLLALIMSFFVSRETLPPEKRKSSGLSTREKIAARYGPLRKPVVLFTLALLFLVQFSYIGYIEFFGWIALNRLGMNAMNTAILWLLGALLVIIIDGLLVGKLSSRFNERWLVLVGMGMLVAGLILAATTPQTPVNWYSKSEIVEELTLEESFLGDVPVNLHNPEILPAEDPAGWFGLGWFLIALCLVMIGGSMLIPTIKSLLMSDQTDYGISGVMSISSILYKSAILIVPLVLGFTIRQVGFTAPFLVEAVVLGVFLVIAYFVFIRE